MKGQILADMAPNGRRMLLTFGYDREDVEAIKSVPGARFTPADKGGPFWTVPLDLETGRMLRSLYGDRLKLTSALKEWGNETKKEFDTIASIVSSEDVKLEKLPKVLPKLAKTLRPEQRVGVKFGAVSRHPLFGDAPRVGKTLQSIGAIFEAGLGNGPHLVIAPVTALDTVWEVELRKWQKHPVFVAMGPKQERERIIAKAKSLHDSGKPFWLVVNFDMVSYRSMFVECLNHMRDEPVSVKRKCSDCEEYKVSEFSLIHEIEWNGCIIDEGSKSGVRNPSSSTGEALGDIKAKKKMHLNGTPMGGKHINLWGILHMLRPDIFTSKWNWAGLWLNISDNGYGKVIGELREEKAEQFYRSLIPFMISRERTGVPIVEDVDLDIHMTSGQSKQYNEFASDAEIRIEEEDLSATSILAEYTRLKQFASAKQSIEKVRDETRLVALPDSGKLEKLMELLDERGILDGSLDHPIVVFSQFKSIVDMLYAYLAKKKVKIAKITGDQTKGRKTIIEDFQAGNYAVLAMTTTAGGTAITLDTADACVFWDETWDPDDQTQAKNRIAPVNRMVPKTAYFMRSIDTIEQYIQDVNITKNLTNREVLRGIRLR